MIIKACLRIKEMFKSIFLQKEKLTKPDLEKIIRKAEEDYKSGRFIKETAEEHFKRIGI